MQRPDKLLDAIVCVLAAGLANNQNEHGMDWVLSGMTVIAAERRWNYVCQLCMCARYEQHCGSTGKTPTLPDIAQLIQTLIFNHRINDALYLKFCEQSEIEEWLSQRSIRLPARFLNIPGTDRWYSGATIRDTLLAIAQQAQTKPSWRRQGWVRKILIQRFKSLNKRMLDAGLMQLQKHAGALNEMQWRRVTKQSRHDAIHVRIHYSTAFMKITVRVGGVTVARYRNLPLVFGKSLHPEERASLDAHYAPRFISMKVFDIIVAIIERQEAPELKRWLQDFYELFLSELFDRADIKVEIAKLDEFPTLVIATHGALAQLPFGALFDGERFLAERFNIVQAPPVFEVAELPEGYLDTDAMRGGGADFPRHMRVLANERALSHVAYEIDSYRRIAERTGMPIEIYSDLVERSWDAETLRWLMQARGIAILSTHVGSSPSSAHEVALQTPDGRTLLAAEAIVGRFNCDLLVLAGCASNNATDWLAPNENSLTSVCRWQGAKSVISTLWPISDYTARRYNELLVEKLANGASRVGAHGHAQRSLAKEQATRGQLEFGERKIWQDDADEAVDSSYGLEGLIPLDHPYFWAGFILSGAWE